MRRVPASIQRVANAPFPWMLDLRTMNGRGRATPLLGILLRLAFGGRLETRAD
jgi:hypothetical protein